MTMPTFEPVAFIATTWQICFMGSGPIAPLTKKHNLKIGTQLFTESQLQQAYEAGLRDAVPEGFTLVPNEPTMPMLIELNEIAIIVAGLGHEDGPQRVLTDGYKAMLAAAPKGD